MFLPPPYTFNTLANPTVDSLFPPSFTVMFEVSTLDELFISVISSSVASSGISTLEPPNTVTAKYLSSFSVYFVLFSTLMLDVVTLEFRPPPYTDNQFVLARDMVIDSQAYVVGFLSEYDKIRDFEDGTWVEIIGTITKGNYHKKDIPIIKVKELKIIEKPQDEFVSPPENTYIPTSAIL